MKRYSEFGYHTRETLKGWMIVPAVIFAIAWALAFTIDVLAIDDQNDIAEASHTGSVPAHVVTLNADAYLLQDGSHVTPQDICHGSTTEGANARESRRIDALNAVYVQCYLDQSWNVKQETIDPNLGQALGTSIAKPAFIITGVVGLGIALLLPLILLLNEAVAIAAGYKQRKVDKREKYNALAARYRAIQASYSRDEIDDLQFDKKVQELVKEGYNLPDRDIFKT